MTNRFVAGALRHCIVYLLVWGWVVSSAVHSQDAAADAAADSLFGLAVRLMEDGDLARAREEFIKYTNQFPKSVRALEAQARVHLASGELALRERRPPVAREAFEALRRLEGAPAPLKAAGHLGLAETELIEHRPEAAEKWIREMPGTNQLAASMFHRAALLSADAARQKGAFADAERILGAATDLSQGPGDEWRRERALTQVLLEAQRTNEAVQAALRMRQWTTNSALAVARPESTALVAQAYDALGQTGAARTNWLENLAGGTPLAWRRDATLRLANSWQRTGETQRARETLETFIGQNPGDDEPSLRLGELLLAEHTRQRSLSNLVSELASRWLAPARQAFSNVIAIRAEGPLVPWAAAGLGESYWSEFLETSATNLLQTGLPWLEQAAQKLPDGTDRLSIRLLLGSALRQLGNHRGALEQFTIVGAAETAPVGRPALLKSRALREGTVAALTGDKPAVAQDFARRLWTHAPGTPEAESAAVIVIKHLGARRAPDKALEFQSSLTTNNVPRGSLAGVRLAVAMGFVESDEWTNALYHLDHWQMDFPDDPRIPQAEFQAAFAGQQAGTITNALQRFQQLTEKHPTNRLAQLAYLWLGGRFEESEDYVQAEQAYRAILANKQWAGSDVWFRAHLLAARASLARGLPADLTNSRADIKGLLNHPGCPVDLKPVAFFVLGDTIRRGEIDSPTNAISFYQEARSAYEAATRLDPNHPIVPAAWGAVANCYFQIGGVFTNAYTNAVAAYERVLAHPLSTVSLRSEAHYGIGLTLEKAGDVNGALRHCQNVLYGWDLKPLESPNPHWVRNAGIHAGYLLENLGRPDDAIKVYERLKDLLPRSREALDAKIARARNLAIPAK